MTRKPDDKMQKRERLKEFRSFRTSKRRKPKERNERKSDKEGKLKHRILFVREKLKRETKQLSLKLKLNERKTLLIFLSLKIVAFLILHCDFS